MGSILSRPQCVILKLCMQRQQYLTNTVTMLTRTRWIEIHIKSTEYNISMILDISMSRIVMWPSVWLHCLKIAINTPVRECLQLLNWHFDCLVLDIECFNVKYPKFCYYHHHHRFSRMALAVNSSYLNEPWSQGPWGQHGAHLGTTGPMLTPWTLLSWKSYGDIVIV